MPSQWALGDQNVQIEHVVNSQIHVTFDGQRHMLPLEAAVVPPGHNNASPARLVRARSGVVPYTARGDLIKRLEAWITQPKAFAGCVIGGRGGTGKTKLAVELAERAAAAQWVSGLLSRRTDLAALEELAHTPAPRFIVVDYAETRLEQIDLLLPMLAHRATTEHRIRIMLLVRTRPRLNRSDWKEALRHRGDVLDRLLDDMTVEQLERMPLSRHDRHALFDAAALAFGDERQGQVCRSSLEAPAFTSPLLVVIAAYIAAHSRSGVPASKSGLLEELLRHEERYWHGVGIGRDLDSHRARRIVALATLAGAENAAQAHSLLRLLPDFADATQERLGELSRWAGALYEDEDSYWNPLEPDLLGEHLVAECYRDAPEVLAGILRDSRPERLIRPLTLLARAAVDSHELTLTLSNVIGDALPRLCAIAVRQVIETRDLGLLSSGGSLADALDQAIRGLSLPVGQLADAFLALPERPDLVLRSLALTVTGQFVAALDKFRSDNRQAYEDPRTAINQMHAQVMGSLAGRLHENGRLDEAISTITQAIALLESLHCKAGHDPECEKSWGTQLSNYGNLLLDSGSPLEAAESLRAGRDRLLSAERNGAENVPAALAATLSNLAVSLLELRQDVEALNTLLDALAIRRGLADSDPETYGADVAMTLNNLGVCLLSLEHLPGAIEALREAAIIRRRLARRFPSTYLPGLVETLANLASALEAADQRLAATHILREAVRVYERLADHDDSPTRQTSHAVALCRLATAVQDPENPDPSFVGWRVESTDAARRSLELLSGVIDEPASIDHLRVLIQALSVLASHAQIEDRQLRALVATQHMVDTLFELVARVPGEHEVELARGLHSLSGLLLSTQDPAGAAIAMSEAIEIRRELIAGGNDDDATLDRLAELTDALMGLSCAQSAVGESEAALGSVEEALGLGQRLVDADWPEGAQLLVEARGLQFQYLGDLEPGPTDNQ